MEKTWLVQIGKYFLCPLRLRELVQWQTGSRESIIVREVEHGSKTTRSFY